MSVEETDTLDQVVRGNDNSKTRLDCDDTHGHKHNKNQVEKDFASVELDNSNGSLKKNANDNSKTANGYGKCELCNKDAPPKSQTEKIRPNLEPHEPKHGNRINKDDKSKKDSKDKKLIEKNGKIRHIVTLLALSSILLANANRQAYNQALVRMVRRPSTASAVSLTSNTTTSATNETSELIWPTLTNSNESAQDTTPSSSGLNGANNGIVSVEIDKLTNDEVTDFQTIATVALEEDRYDWNSAQISLLQASFSYGYVPFMIPGGRLSEIYGAKWVVFLSGFGSALCSILTPFLADNSFVLLICSRILMGICQTGVSPALYALLTRWLPPDESSVYLPMIKVGVVLGFTTGSLINGFLSWRMTFYMVGLVGLLWSCMWTFCVSSVPDENKFIGKSELNYIHQQLGRVTIDSDNSKAQISSPEGKAMKKKTQTRKKSAPWLSIVTNPVVIAFMFAKFTVKMSTDTQTMQLPMYLSNVFEVSDRLNGTLNAANFAIQAIFTGFVAFMAKEMVVRETLSKTGVRRLFQGINNFGTAFAYILISFNMGSLGLVCGAVIFLAVSSMFGAGGEAVLPIDLTTEYSASIMAIANSTANLSGIVLPPIVSFLLDGQLSDSQHWNYVWWFLSGVMILGGLAFGCFVEADVQDFSKKSRLKRKTNSYDMTLASADNMKSSTVIEIMSTRL